MIFQSKYDLDDNRAVIRRLHRGDMACFEACYKFYYRGLCSFASRWVPVSTAEDIVQDAMLYIWENRDKLLEELSLKGVALYDRPQQGVPTASPTGRSGSASTSS